MMKRSWMLLGTLSALATGCASNTEVEDVEDVAADEEVGEGTEELSAGEVRIQSANAKLIKRCVREVSAGRVSADFCANSVPGQGWRYTSASKTLRTHGGKCLAAVGGTAVVQGCSTAAAQDFTVAGAEETVAGVKGKRIRANNQCLTLDDKGATSLSACRAAANQLWSLPTNATAEFPIPAGDMKVLPETKPVAVFAASLQTRAETRDVIRRWELYTFYTGAKFTAPTREYVSAGWIYVGRDVNGRPRAMVTARTQRETVQAPKEGWLDVSAKFADGSGTLASLQYKDGKATSPPTALKGAGRNMVQAVLRDTKAAPLPMNAPQTSVINWGLAVVGVAMIFNPAYGAVGAVGMLAIESARLFGPLDHNGKPGDAAGGDSQCSHYEVDAQACPAPRSNKCQLQNSKKTTTGLTHCEYSCCGEGKPITFTMGDAQKSAEAACGTSGYDPSCTVRKTYLGPNLPGSDWKAYQCDYSCKSLPPQWPIKCVHKLFSGIAPGGPPKVTESSMLTYNFDPVANTVEGKACFPDQSR